MKQGLDGLTLFGTNGEASSFSIEQKKETIQFLLDNRIDPKILMPGSGSSSLEDAIEMTKFCANIGTKAALVLPPYYFKNVSDEGVITYYRNVIEACGDNSFHFLLYNIPQHSGVTINFNIIENLIKLYPNNVIGLKDSTGNIDNMLKIIKPKRIYLGKKDMQQLKIVKTIQYLKEDSVEQRFRCQSYLLAECAFNKAGRI